MKKPIILLFAALVLLLAGCGKAPEGTAAATGGDGNGGAYPLKVPPEDRNQAFSFQSFVETPDGCYYGLDNMSAGGVMIYFCPRGGNAFYPLCSKPNCRHEDKNCNAYAGEVFGYYDGSLYAAGPSTNLSGLNVVKMNLDGTDHQVVATVDFREKTPQSYTLNFHHGKLFIQGCAPYDMEIQENHLVILDLADFSETDYLQENAVSNYTAFYKDKLYGATATTVYLDEATGEYKASSDYKLIETDAATGAARVLLPKRITSLYATDSTLFYFEPDRSRQNEATGTNNEKVEPGFRELDLKTGAVKDCGLPVEDIYFVSYDEDYIYATSYYRNDSKDSTLYLLTRDYKLVDQIEKPDGLSVAAVSSDRIYLSDPFSNSPINYYIDKAQIGSHELQLIPIETVGYNEKSGME